MEYISVAKIAEKWGLSERSVRNYCAHGRIADAKLIGKTWYIPEDAQKPERANKKNEAPTLLQILREQKAAKMIGGNYHKVQIDLTYNSNHIEDIVAFHVAFERIHPFQDGNGRVGRLILFKECLKHNIVPFIIEDNT